MKSFLLALLAAGSLLIAFAGCADNDASAKPLTYEESVETTVTAKVLAVNHANRTLTLQGTEGHQITFFRVSDEVRRLNEVKVGDEVKVRYVADLLAELRPPTSSEMQNPIAVIETEERSVRGSDPSRTTTRATRVVTTVEAVDVPNMLVTLRGPMGDLAVVRGKKAENVRKLHVGDTIVITFTRSVVVSLDKVGTR